LAIEGSMMMMMMMMLKMMTMKYYGIADCDLDFSDQLL